MKKISTIFRTSMVAMAAVAALGVCAKTNKVAMLIDGGNVDACNSQEKAAALYLQNQLNGDIITPSELDKIDVENYDAIWVHIDRLNIGMGWEKLPADIKSDATINALKKFVAAGGSLYLSKHATQLVVPLGRVDAQYAPGLYGDGDGGLGTDVWTVNAHLGYWKGYLADEADRDVNQVYDRRNHAIYTGMSTWPAHCGLGFSEYETETFPLLGTGNGTEMHREDHNCMWDLNAYSYTADGANTVEKFENQNNCQVLGTWGHVIDFAVAGIVDFLPQTNGEGHIVANGLAACEWAPRNGVNAYHANLEKLTANTMNFLVNNTTTEITSVSDVDVANEGAAVYYSIQGVRVENPANGLYIKVQNGVAEKVYLK